MLCLWGLLGLGAGRLGYAGDPRATKRHAVPVTHPSCEFDYRRVSSKLHEKRQLGRDTCIDRICEAFLGIPAASALWPIGVSIGGLRLSVSNQSAFGVSDVLCASGRLRLENMREFPGYTSYIVCMIDRCYQYTGTGPNDFWCTKLWSGSGKARPWRGIPTSMHLPSIDYTAIFYTTPAWNSHAYSCLILASIIPIAIDYYSYQSCGSRPNSLSVISIPAVQINPSLWLDINICWERQNMHSNLFVSIPGKLASWSLAKQKERERKKERKGCS